MEEVSLRPFPSPSSSFVSLSSGKHVGAESRQARGSWWAKRLWGWAGSPQPALSPSWCFPPAPSSSVLLRLPRVKGRKLPRRLSPPAEPIPSRLSSQHSWHSLMLSGIILAGGRCLLWSGVSQQAQNHILFGPRKAALTWRPLHLLILLPSPLHQGIPSHSGLAEVWCARGHVPQSTSPAASHRSHLTLCHWVRSGHGKSRGFGGGISQPTSSLAQTSVAKPVEGTHSWSTLGKSQDSGLG